MTFSAPKAIAVAATLTAFGQPALAQDICGGAGQWIGGGEGSSDISTADGFREQMALVLSGNEYVSLFKLSAPTSVRVEAAGRGNADPLIDLLDADGNVILTDDDSGGDGNARAEVDLQPGTYCLNLVSYDGAPMTAFVRIGRTDQEALTTGLSETADVVDTPDPGATTMVAGSCADATPLGTLDGPISGTGSVNSDPYWRFSLAAPTAISVTAQNEDADPVITLLDADETYLAENDDFDGLNSRIDMTVALPAGDYCISVDALSDRDLPIDIMVDTYDPVAALQGLYARGEAAPPLDGSYPVTELGVLGSRLRHDANVGSDAQWFVTEINEGGLLLVEAIAAGGNGDPSLVLFDDLGRQIAYNDDNGDSYDSLVTARVTPGTYMIGVKQVGSGTQGFIRMVLERYVPAP